MLELNLTSFIFLLKRWNWRNVVEDDKMLLNQFTGELLHPVHLQRLIELGVPSQVGFAPPNIVG